MKGPGDTVTRRRGDTETRPTSYATAYFSVSPRPPSPCLVFLHPSAFILAFLLARLRTYPQHTRA